MIIFENMKKYLLSLVLFTLTTFCFVQSTQGQIGWANLHWPGSGIIALGDDFVAYARVYIEGQTGSGGPAPNVQAWIGYNTENNTPDDSWTWIVSSYNAWEPAHGNNDEYMANIGITISTPGTYYYASRFQFNNGDYVYGGYCPCGGGGFWNGTNNASGVLIVKDTITYTLTLKANPTDGGTVNGAGNYEKGVVVPVSATPAINYVFVNWTKDGFEVSDQPSFNYTMPAENVTLVTNFDLIITIDELDNKILIYPNPTYGQFEIYVKESFILEIYDATNRIIETKQIEAGKTIVDLTPEKKGIYFIKLINDNKVINTIIILQ